MRHLHCLDNISSLTHPRSMNLGLVSQPTAVHGMRMRFRVNVCTTVTPWSRQLNRAGLSVIRIGRTEIRGRTPCGFRPRTITTLQINVSFQRFIRRAALAS